MKQRRRRTPDGYPDVLVPTVSLDEYFKGFVSPDLQVILIKMDVEGAEFRVLQGAEDLLKNCRVKRWAISVHRPSLHQMVSEILERNGYRIQTPSAHGWQPNDEILATCTSRTERMEELVGEIGAAAN